MSLSFKGQNLVLLWVVSLSFFGVQSTSAVGDQQSRLAPKIISLELEGKDYLRVLGPPESVSLRSGLVLLQPQKSVGRHSTESYEEMIIVLEGKGQMVMADGNRIPFQAGQALYCPPETEHDVFNTGSEPLRYIYVVAKAK